jgi:nicotinamide-nucleotide amidase
MHSEVIATGAELLLGEIASTNTAFIGRQLAAAGLLMRFESLVGDDIDDIADAIERACGRSPVVIVTGGLWPTGDDLTREAIARAAGASLRFDPAVYEGIESFFRSRGRPTPECNRRQAMVIEGSRIIPNPNGTAPGVDIEIRGARLFALPGVPSEMEPMVMDGVLPAVAGLRMKRMDRSALCVRRLHVSGLGESAIEDRLPGRIGPGRNPEFQTRAHAGWVTLRIVARGETADDAGRRADAAAAEARAAMAGHVFAEGEQTLASAALYALVRGGLTLAVAESCTGGLIAGAFTDVPGSSAAFIEGFVTYADKAKERALGVPREVIVRCGAVSEETARAMARGARARSGSDIALAATGVAGPDGGVPDKPVGTVWLAIDSARGTAAEKFSFRGTRAAIRERAVQQALDMVRREALSVSAK